MDAVCAVLPEKVRDECKSFVEVYGKAVIDMVLESTDPQAVCVMLKCCSSKAVPAGKNLNTIQCTEYMLGVRAAKQYCALTLETVIFLNSQRKLLQCNHRLATFVMCAK